jgi:hypothetical protein
VRQTVHTGFARPKGLPCGLPEQSSERPFPATPFDLDRWSRATPDAAQYWLRAALVMNGRAPGDERVPVMVLIPSGTLRCRGRLREPALRWLERRGSNAGITCLSVYRSHRVRVGRGGRSTTGFLVHAR